MLSSLQHRSRQWPAVAAAVTFSALAWGTPAADADATIEAESMTLRAGKIARERGASGGRAAVLGARGSASRRVTTASAALLVVFARRETCRRSFTPLTMRVTVDGRPALLKTVRRTSYGRYGATVALPAGTHALKITFSSRRRAGACDSRVRVDRLLLVERTGTSGQSVPTTLVAPSAAAAEPAPGAPMTQATGGVGGPRGPLLFLGDFEPGNLSQWSRDVHRQAPERIQVTQSPVRRGRYAARFALQDGDMVFSGERSEVLWGSSPNPTLRDGQEHYIGWSTYFPTDYPVSGGHQLFLQTHPEGPLAPPIEMRCDEERISLYLTDPNGPSFTPWQVPLTRGVWHDFVLRARWSPDPSVGFVELWHNGVKVVSNQRIATLDSPGVDSYLKLGYYRPGSTAQPPGAVHHDEMRVGLSYEAVAPGG